MVATRSTNKRLTPAPGSAIVRMYRIGHGDCFLIAYRARPAGSKPVYILIDCGYKPGSNGADFINTKPADVVKSIREATGGRLDVAVITHEHQDHVNAINATAFNGFQIDEAWFAWTEDPEDALANDLREQYRDRLLQLVAARNQLAADGDVDQVSEIDAQLEFSLGGDDAVFNLGAAAQLLAADSDLSRARNKVAMKVFKDLAGTDRIRFLSPHTKPRTVAGAPGLKAFVLGPPRHGQKLTDDEPLDGEAFPRFGLAADTDAGFLSDAIRGCSVPPFAPRYCVPIPRDAEGKPEAPAGEFSDFYQNHYGAGMVLRADEVVEDNAEWRRIDSDWLYSAAQLALKMGNYINNTSLVLAFELGTDGKVLLFAADAQSGNWKSWTDDDFKDGSRTVTTRDLLSRTVLYKVGHHGSHNATLNGQRDDEYSNLSWMGEGEHAREFTAMITAVRDWAQQPSVGWDHPLESIKSALLKKACGRVFQTDTNVASMKKSPGTRQADWDSFQSRTKDNTLYLDYTIQF